ncbi:MAG: cobaltochelatase subunit CobN, partial [Chloroflexota bacterium]|nr:cobaltochelatase subunit CobN [Chloroflexota bacterium]
RRPSGQRSAESFAGFVGKVSRWLRFAPGRGQDFRTYLLLYTYYLHSSPDNWRNLLLLVLQRYGGTKLEAQPPIEYPTASLYHPDAPRQFEQMDDYLAWFHEHKTAPGPGAARVGIILFRSFVLNGNTAHYDAVIRAVEARGLIPVPALSFALDNRVVQRRYFGKVSAILSLTGFGYVGGMGANDSTAAIEALEAHGVPYLDAVALNFQHIEEWRSSEVGLNPLQSMMQVAIPELDGAIEPLLFGGVTADAEGFQALPERIERLVDRLAGLVKLRTLSNDRKRLAVVLFNFPPNRGNLGTAAYLDVFGSLHRLLLRLRDEGYTVEVPATPDDLRRAVAEGNSGDYGTPANVAATVSVAD